MTSLRMRVVEAVAEEICRVVFGQALERIAEWETNHVKTPEMTAEKERLLRQLAIFESVRIDATPSVSSNPSALREDR